MWHAMEFICTCYNVPKIVKESLSQFEPWFCYHTIRINTQLDKSFSVPKKFTIHFLLLKENHAWLVIRIIIFLDHSSFHICAVKALTHTGYREKKSAKCQKSYISYIYQTDQDLLSRYFIHHAAGQTELSCAGTDIWQKFQIVLDLFHNSL